MSAPAKNYKQSYFFPLRRSAPPPSPPSRSPGMKNGARKETHYYTGRPARFFTIIYTCLFPPSLCIFKAATWNISRVFSAAPQTKRGKYSLSPPPPSGKLAAPRAKKVMISRLTTCRGSAMGLDLATLTNAFELANARAGKWTPRQSYSFDFSDSRDGLFVFLRARNSMNSDFSWKHSRISVCLDRTLCNKKLTSFAVLFLLFLSALFLRVSQLHCFQIVFNELHAASFIAHFFK